MNHYYYILGLNPHATVAEVKKAYRRLALQYHPDRNPDNPQAAARFREITDAYHHLIAHREKQYETRRQHTAAKHPSGRPYYQNTFTQFRMEQEQEQKEAQDRKAALHKANALYKGSPILDYKCPRCGVQAVRRIVSYSELHGASFIPYLLNVARCDNCAYIFNRRTYKPVSDTKMQILSILIGFLICGALYLLLINNLDLILS